MMSRLVILNLNMKFGDFLVVVSVWLLGHIVVFGHPSSSKNELQAQTRTEESSDMLRIAQELEPIAGNGTDNASSHFRSDSELFDGILKVLIASYQSEINKQAEDEQMQGDQPLCVNGTDDQTIEKTRETQHQIMKDAAKQTRNIQVLNDFRVQLGRHVPKNISSGLDPTLKDNIQYELMNQKPENMEYYSDTTTMYPNCTLPPEIDKDEWFNTSNRINLYFMSQRSAPRHRVKVVHANLNLYKLPFKFNDGKISPIQVDSSPNSTDNKTITVQIFYFKKPLRKVNPGEKPVRKTLIDTKVLLASREEKTQWNLTAAAQEWQNNSSRNLGITIIVKDEKNRKLPAHLIFGQFDCSNATRLPPRIPTYILNILRLSNQTLYQDYQAKYEKLPTLDLTTKDFLEDEYDMFDEDTSRKVRHERQKKNNKQKPKQHRSSSAESVEE